MTVSSGYHNSDNDRHSVEKAGKIVQPFCRDLFSITDLLKFSCSVHWNASGPSDSYLQVVIRTVTTLPEVTAVLAKGDFNCSRTGSLVQVRNMRSVD